MSQEDLADMFHVSRQTISNWENSKSYPDLETIVKMSDSFNISLDILLKEDLVMVKTFDNEIKNTRKYARALIAIAVIFALFIGSFVIYSCVYFSTKSKLEGNFAEQLKENHFYKNRDGYYSMNYTAVSYTHLTPVIHTDPYNRNYQQRTDTNGIGQPIAERVFYVCKVVSKGTDQFS